MVRLEIHFIKRTDRICPEIVCGIARGKKEGVEENSNFGDISNCGRIVDMCCTGGKEEERQAW